MNQQNNERIPPQNIEAEQSILGGIMLDNDTLDLVSEFLNADDFYKSAHQKIYTSMMELDEKDEPIDAITLNNHLKQKDLLENVGGTSYIAFLSSSIPTAANVEYYAKIVHDKSALRKVIALSSTLSIEAYGETDDIDRFLDRTERKIFDISNSKSRASCVKIGELVTGAFKTIENIYEKKEVITGLRSGFKDLDDILSGLQPSDLIIIAARPSMGKTALALNIAQNVGIHQDHTVVIFSLEMSKEQLATRMLCSEAEVDMQRVRTGFMRGDDFPKLTQAAGALSNSNIYIDDTASISIIELRSKARRLKAEGNLDLVIVDYLQLMGATSKKDVREQVIADISRSLKALAKELNIPVIALSQLNRALESRDNKRPRLSDLRESGAIEQDADVIGFIYRDEMYDKKSKDKGVAELIIGKQRNGPTGTVRLTFRTEFTRFYDIEERQEDESGFDFYND